MNSVQFENISCVKLNDKILECQFDYVKRVLKIKSKNFSYREGKDFITVKITETFWNHDEEFMPMLNPDQMSRIDYTIRFDKNGVIDWFTRKTKFYTSYSLKCEMLSLRCRKKECPVIIDSSKISLTFSYIFFSNFIINYRIDIFFFSSLSNLCKNIISRHVERKYVEELPLPVSLKTDIIQMCNYKFQNM